MEIQTAAIAEYAIIDQQGRMSILGIFDSVTALSFPIRHPRLFVCVRIACRPIEAGTTHKVLVVLQGPDGQQVARVEGEFTVPAERLRGGPMAAQLVFDFVGLEFAAPGSYSVELGIDGSHRRTIPLLIVAGNAHGQS